jgi:(p)ppGpp synthase/HD superfamily hydrolase
MINQAKKLSKDAHSGMKDQAGVDYFSGHVSHVAGRAKKYGEVYGVVGYLHDVVEDTNVTLKDIRDQFGDEVADAVDAITKRSGESYQRYLSRVKANKIATVVKLVDMNHNSDLSRLKREPNEYDVKRNAKYSKATAYLS